jgi:hypothetical protein
VTHYYVIETKIATFSRPGCQIEGNIQAADVEGNSLSHVGVVRSPFLLRNQLTVYLLMIYYISLPQLTTDGKIGTPKFQLTS